MKFVIVLGVLCFIAVASAKKAEKSLEDNVDSEWSSNVDKTDEHQVKKYGKGAKYSHHHHSKHQKSTDGSEQKHRGRTEGKKAKHIPKQAPHEISPEEAELQADLYTSKKHLKDQHVKDAQQDLHLQDLSFEETLKKEEQSVKSPHQYQRGHHKTSHHFADSKDLKTDHNPSEVEKKLFADQTPKEQQEKSPHPILEDSFETLQENGKSKQAIDSKKHDKKYNKHKKQQDKAKQGKKSKNSKKEKKNKKEKKQKKW